MKRIVLTGGGTAGHVTPNIALLDGLKAQGYEIRYIGSYDGIEKSLIEKEGIPYVGAGHNLEEASRPVYFVTDKLKIAVLSATQIERMDNPATKGATENGPGVFRCRNVDHLLQQVA